MDLKNFMLLIKIGNITEFNQVVQSTPSKPARPCPVHHDAGTLPCACRDQEVRAPLQVGLDAVALPARQMLQLSRQKEAGAKLALISCERAFLHACTASLACRSACVRGGVEACRRAGVLMCVLVLHTRVSVCFCVFGLACTGTIVRARIPTFVLTCVCAQVCTSVSARESVRAARVRAHLQASGRGFLVPTFAYLRATRSTWHAFCMTCVSDFAARSGPGL
jgi:hypothetical protein